MWPWGHSMTLKTSNPQTNQWGEARNRRHMDQFNPYTHFHLPYIPTFLALVSLCDSAHATYWTILKICSAIAFIIIWKGSEWNLVVHSEERAVIIKVADHKRDIGYSHAADTVPYTLSLSNVFKSVKWTNISDKAPTRHELGELHILVG